MELVPIKEHSKNLIGGWIDQGPFLKKIGVTMFHGLSVNLSSGFVKV